MSPPEENGFDPDLVDAMRRVRYCLALLGTIIGCESLPGMKVDNPVVGPPPPRVVAPRVDEQPASDEAEPKAPVQGDKVAGTAVIEQVSNEVVADVSKFPYDPEFPDTMLVATVNSMPITVGDVLEPYKMYLEKTVKPQVPPEKYGEIRREWVKQKLPEVIDRKLRVSGLTAGLKDKQLKALNEYLEKSWVDYKVELCKKMGVASVELEDRMKEEGVELSRVKQNWREGSMAHQFQLLKINSTYEPDRADLLDYYREHYEDWAYPSRVKWQQILVRKQKAETREAAEQRAQAIMQQLRDGGDFTQIASQESDGPTKDKGGYWDWTEAGALACREEEEFLFSGDIGATSEMIPYRDEFHIVRILDRVEAGHREFTQVQPEIRDALKKADRERLARKAVAELMKTAVIETAFGDDWKFEHPLLEASSR